VSAEQAAIEARLLELEGMQNIQAKLKNININEGDEMNVDLSEHPVPKAIDTKQRVLAKYVRTMSSQLVMGDDFLIFDCRPESGTAERRPKCRIIKFSGGYTTGTTRSHTRFGETAETGGEA